QNDECRVHERLKAEIAVHIFRERTIIRDISGLRLKTHVGLGPRTTLTGQPLLERSQKGLAWSRYSKPLIDSFQPVRDVVPEELTDDRASDVAGGFAAEEACCVDWRKSGCAQVGNGRRCERVAAVLVEWHVAHEGEPVKLDHLRRHALACESRRRGELQCS